MSNEIAFCLGLIRAYVDAPQTGERCEPVYMADNAIRIKREALLDQYEVVLREVARISRLSPLYVDVVLQGVRSVISD